MTPKERQVYAERFLIQRFAELTTEVSEPVTFTVETGYAPRLVWTQDDFSVTVELSAEVFVTIRKGTRYFDEKALFESDEGVSFTAARLALGRLMTDVKGLAMLATDLKGLMK